MIQLELFEGLVPVREYLHVWNDAERARRVKQPDGEAQAKGRNESAWEQSARPEPERMCK